MKIKLLASATALAVASSYAAAQPASFTEYVASDQALPVADATPTDVPVTPAATDLGGGVMAYSDEAEFQAAAGTLVMDSFGSSKVPPAGVCGDATPLSTTTDDSCYAAGDLQPGYLYNSFGPEATNYAFLGVGFSSNTVDLLTPDFFVNNAELVFSPAVRSLGAYLHEIEGFGATNATIEIFDAGNTSLGSVAVVGTPEGQFFGFTSEGAEIARITIVAPGTENEALSRLQFSTELAAPPEPPKPVPALGLIGLAGTAIGVLGAGLAGMRRRRA